MQMWYNEKRVFFVKGMVMFMGKNIILYGPPGTGKTYNSVNYALAIIYNIPVEAVMKKITTPCWTATTSWKTISVR